MRQLYIDPGGAYGRLAAAPEMTAFFQQLQPPLSAEQLLKSLQMRDAYTACLTEIYTTRSGINEQLRAAQGWAEMPLNHRCEQLTVLHNVIIT